MLFSKEENEIISNVFFEEIIKGFELIDLLIIKRLIEGEKNETVEKSVHLSHKGFYKRKDKIKNKLMKYYKLLKVS